MRRPQSLGLIFVIGFALISSPALATGNCSDCVDLSGEDLPISVTGQTLGASNDYHPFSPFSQEPACWNGAWDNTCAWGPDMAYKWTAPADGLYTVHLSESNYDAELLIYDFTCPEEPVYPGDFICGSHAGIANRGIVTNIDLDADQEILIVVDGYDYDLGSYELMIYESSQMEIPIGDAMATYGLPGLQATIVACGGDSIWTGSYGLANIEEDIAVTDETLFLCASVSKTITGTAVMQLYEDGLLGPDGLDADVDALLPGAIEVVHPDHPDVPITVRMLLSHFAAISHFQEQPNDLFVCDQNSPVTLADFVEGYFTPGGAYYDPELNFMWYAPGEGYQYSGPGTALLGYLVEVLSGMEFNEYCRARIFEPLGIAPASFMLEDLLADPGVDHLAMGYRWGWGIWQPYCHMHAPWVPTAFLRTNSTQLSRFLLAIMNGGELDGARILEESSVELMHTRHYAAQGSDYGLLWWYWNMDDRTVWGHWGGWPFFCRTAMFFNADEDIGIVLLTNAGWGPTPDYNLEAVVDLLLDRAAALDCTTVAVDTDGVAAKATVLGPCSPNPFNPMTTISYSLPAEAALDLTVYDLRGKLVRRLKAGVVEHSGDHQVTWDGRNGFGGAMPSGTYIVRLETEDRIESRKVMLVR